MKIKVLLYEVVLLIRRSLRIIHADNTTAKISTFYSEEKKIITFLNSKLKTLFDSMNFHFAVDLTSDPLHSPCHKFAFVRFIHRRKCDNYVYHVKNIVFYALA